jgi:hypothetical protein
MTIQTASMPPNVIATAATLRLVTYFESRWCKSNLSFWDVLSRLLFSHLWFAIRSQHACTQCKSTFCSKCCPERNDLANQRVCSECFRQQLHSIERAKRLEAEKRAVQAVYALEEVCATSTIYIGRHDCLGVVILQTGINLFAG